MPTDSETQATNVDPALLDLPWNLPLEEWPDSLLVTLPRDISRHVVRFVQLNECIVAVKEIRALVACHEYAMLRNLSHLSAPSVVPIAVITRHTDDNGEELNAVLITEHLQFSLPYRAFFSRHMAPDVVTRLTDALAILLVRLHLLDFYWGGVSLSSAFFCRDADSFSTYLVDAEAGELHPKLTSGRRAYDISTTRTNIIGEFMDLQAGTFFPEEADPIHIGDQICLHYKTLWSELTGAEMIDASQKWRVAQKIERLNELGFDVGEFSMSTVAGTSTLKIQPKVVDAGHHHHKLMRLTGMSVEKSQAQRLLNDIQAFHTASGRPNSSLEFSAHEWPNTAFEPVIAAVPPEFAGKSEPAQTYHEFLEHRWCFAKSTGHDIPLDEAVASYVENVLTARRDEALYIILKSGAESPALVIDPDL